MTVVSPQESVTWKIGVFLLGDSKGLEADEM
jgi:hypothetical protein